MAITKNKFKKALEGTGGIMLSIAKNLDCSRQAVYNFCNKHPDMMELRRQEEEKVLDIAENSLFVEAKNGEQWATKYLLATKGKKRGYIEKSQLEHSGIDTNIEIIIPKEVKELLGGENGR
jgi:hypothetical protein